MVNEAVAGTWRLIIQVPHYASLKQKTTSNSDQMLANDIICGCCRRQAEVD